MKFKAFGLAALLLSSTGLLQSQQQPPDPIGESVFPPELVMQHQQAIGLAEDQKSHIRAEIQKAQARFTDLQWQLQSEMETIASLVKHEQVDEQVVLAQLDKILDLEREIKRTHMTLIVRIKNRLLPEQKARLMDLKKSGGGHHVKKASKPGGVIP